MVQQLLLLLYSCCCSEMAIFPFLHLQKLLHLPVHARKWQLNGTRCSAAKLTFCQYYKISTQVLNDILWGLRWLKSLETSRRKCELGKQRWAQAHTITQTLLQLHFLSHSPFWNTSILETYHLSGLQRHHNICSNLPVVELQQSNVQHFEEDVAGFSAEVFC